MKASRPLGYLTLTLHAHLPYVVHHGTWPHGMEWLLEAAAESYLPLLRVLSSLRKDGLALRANVNLSPVLLEQLDHPAFQQEFPRYLGRKMQAAREDEAYFQQASELHFAETARFWQRFYAQALAQFQELGGNLVPAFRAFDDTGEIEVISCAATHGYLPLLGTDESAIAQIKTGVALHRRHMGKHPRGLWIPECGYRPASLWKAPVSPADGASSPEPLDRIGIEEVLALGGIQYTFVDSHLVTGADRFTPYEMAGRQAVEVFEAAPEASRSSLYHPYYIDGPLAHRYPVAAFPRDPRTGLQVWSGEHGYPGDPIYLDFHKKRWPGGLRYWQVTDARADLQYKTPYYPEEAARRTREHAQHFVHLVKTALAPEFNAERPPVLSALFDAELFGHWWFEGPLWLEHVARLLEEHETQVSLTTAGDYLQKYPPEGYLALPEGSWGKNGTHEVWLNDQTSWTWQEIYAAEERVRAIVSADTWRDGGVGERIVKQLCRELLLLESSDWQFLITTAAARDYAQDRLSLHVCYVKEIESVWRAFEPNRSLTPEWERRLREVEDRDNIFPEIDPGLWARRDPAV